MDGAIDWQKKIEYRSTRANHSHIRVLMANPMGPWTQETTTKSLCAIRNIASIGTYLAAATWDSITVTQP